MQIQAPKGTNDILPAEIYKWHYIEKVIGEICRLFGYKEIRIPVYEHTELFVRSVGDTTDIVQKEMFTFTDNGGRSITLRPEGTAGVVRSYIENGMASLPQPVKLYYMHTFYRQENVQKGRYREFNQFGIELLGAKGPEAEVELISLISTLLERLEIKDVTLNINSIGCSVCRKDYHTALKSFLGKRLDELCETCKERYEKNPMRILDCKEEKCGEITAEAPVVIEYLCDECKTHFNKLEDMLVSLEIPYKINPKIVRGLDYYTKTVFEFVSNKIGAQGTVCGGGRYDGLIEECGGTPTYGLGFGMGMERLLAVMESNNAEIPHEKKPDLFIATIGDRAKERAEKKVLKLRKQGLSAHADLMGRSLKAQMKYADKIGAKFVLILGDEELATGVAKIREMAAGEETDIKLEDIAQFLKNKQEEE